VEPPPAGAEEFQIAGLTNWKCDLF